MQSGMHIKSCMNGSVFLRAVSVEISCMIAAKAAPPMPRQYPDTVLWSIVETGAQSPNDPKLSHSGGVARAVPNGGSESSQPNNADAPSEESTARDTP